MGMVKVKKYNFDSGFEVLVVQWVLKMQVWQCIGRVGREDSGICYWFYMEEEFEKFDKMIVLEIQRCNLVSVMFQFLVMKVLNVFIFDFMFKLFLDYIQVVIVQLDLLGVFEYKDDQFFLILIGRKMVVFFLEFKFVKIIFMFFKFYCIEEILIIVFLLFVDSVFYNFFFW